MTPLLLLLLLSCGRLPAPSGREATAIEVTPRLLALSGEAASAAREFSGLAWCGGRLVLLPQYPAQSGDSAFVLDGAEIEAALSADGALTPRRLPFDDGGASALLPGFEGFEAIACAPDGGLWVTAEARPPGGMTGWLLPGHLTPEGGIVLRPAERVSLPSRSHIANKSDEALWIWQGRPWTLHEVNDVTAAPSAYHLDFEGRLHSLPAPVLPFRVTDATAPDAEGLLWVINYQWEGDRALRRDSDPLLDRWGYGPTHARVPGQRAERLVALQVSPTEGVTLVDRPPVQLTLDTVGRNWEGIARLGEGVLLVTDEHPTTLLAYVPLLAP